MKNIKAIGVAFVLFLVTVAGLKIVARNTMPENSVDYGTWDSSSKYASTRGIDSMLNDSQSMLVLGSSELTHCHGSGFHGDSIYQNTDMKPIFIGAGGYQSLYHTILMGAVGDNIKNKKVVISVSPQWFKPTGVRKDAFGNSYSESHFIAFLKNKNVSKETKEYVISRIETLTADNPVMWDRVQNDVKWYMDGDSNGIDQIRKGIHSYLVNDKSEMKLFLTSFVKGKLRDDSHGKKKKDIDWNGLYKEAGKQGKHLVGNNKYGMYKRIYKRRLKSKVEGHRIKNLDYRLDSIEFKDLQCFLDVCKQEGIEVMMVMQPLNGRWSDFAGYPKEKREKLYEKVRKLAQKNNVQLTDLSGIEYGKYMFEDDSHLGLKGLVNFNEQIYKFYKQN